MTDWLECAAGLVMILAGAEALVRGAVAIALRLSVPPLVVGLTIVAIGTSLPEFVVGIVSALHGASDVGLGTVVGSNLFNLGAILGLSALIYPLAIESRTLRFEYPFLLVATAGTLGLCGDGVLSRTDGLWLLAGAVVFLAYAGIVVRSAVAADRDDEDVRPSGGMTMGLACGLVVVGAGLLKVGGDVALAAAIDLADAWGISQRVIGLTIVAFGTSAPELAVCAVSAFRRHSDIAVGNIVGSCIFNLVGVLGATAVLQPLEVASVILNWDAWWLLGISAGLFPLLFVGRRLGRWDGVLLLVSFAAYYAFLFGR